MSLPEGLSFAVIVTLGGKRYRVDLRKWVESGVTLPDLIREDSVSPETILADIKAAFGEDAVTEVEEL